MSLIRLMASPARREFSCVARRYMEAVCPVAHEKVFLSKQKSVDCFVEPLMQNQHNRLFHTTQIKRDIEAALKSMGAGFAAMGVIGPGIGLGLIFGHLVDAVSRNPSAANKIFQFSILGAALCESVAFFALMIAFIVLS